MMTAQQGGLVADDGCYAFTCTCCGGRAGVLNLNPDDSSSNMEAAGQCSSHPTQVIGSVPQAESIPQPHTRSRN